MPRVVSLWLPTWSTDRLRRRPGALPPDKPLVTAAREGSRRILACADAAAQALGLHVGMTIAQAQAMVPGLTVLEADPVGDTAALDRLAAWSLRYAPIAAADPPDGIIIDITGCAHLFGGEARLLADLTGRFERAGFAACAAVADTWAAAWALARFAAPGTIAPADGTAVLAPLPVAALRLPPDLAAALRRLGFDTVAELAAAPRVSLALRFGSALTRRLDQAFGRAVEPIVPVAPPSTPAVRLAFAEPLGEGAGLGPVLGDLAKRLCTELETKGLGARRLDLLIFRVDGQTGAVRVGSACSTRDAGHIVRLEDEHGQRFWLFRAYDRNGVRWFLHGLFA